MKLAALCYHYVGRAPRSLSSALTMKPERFEAGLAHLARHGYSGITSAQWLEHVRDGAPLPQKPVLITFDDGYADLIEHAFPALERHGFPATVFVVTGLIDGALTVQDWPTPRLMSAAEVRECADRGIEFGAHSRTHPNLTELSADALLAEVGGSRDDLAALLGRPTQSFAYPFGYYNEAVRACVAAHYPLAFTALAGLNDAATDLHLLRRAMVHSADRTFDLNLRLRLGWSPRERLRKRAARSSRRLLGRA